LHLFKDNIGPQGQLAMNMDLEGSVIAWHG
jgi:hypothetical protein